MLSTPTSGYNGHGFYQFSPELFLTVLNNNGFYVEDITYMEEYGNEIYKAYRVEGISEKELNMYKKACMYICAKKIDSTPFKLSAQQGMWEEQWKGKGWHPENNTFYFYDLNREIRNLLGEKIEGYNLFLGKNILLYGAGYRCRELLETAHLDGINIIGIADKNAENISIEGFLVEEFTYFKSYQIDYIVIATDMKIAMEIKKELIYIYDCCEEQIMTLREFDYYFNPCLYLGEKTD